MRSRVTSLDSASKKVSTGSTSSAAAVYQGRLNECRTHAERLQVRDRFVVRVRIAVFVALILIGCLCVGDRSVSFWWLLLPATAFVAVLRFHLPIVRELKRESAAEQFYTRCLSRIDGDWRTFPVDGAEFIDAGHPWAGDLDVFGNGSLFQKLNECRTLPGRRKLAAWLTTVASADVIAERQKQSESLRNEVSLRERLAVIDDTVDWKAAETALSGWLSEPATSFSAFAIWGARVLGLASVVVLIMVFGSGLTGSAILLMLLLQAPFIYVNRQRIRAVMDRVDSVDLALHQLSEVAQQFETFPFTEPSLQRLQQQLCVDGVIASVRIKELSSQIQWLNNALRNQFFMPLAWMFGLFILLTHRIERWRDLYGTRVPDWLDAVTSLEVAISVAAFNFENETYCLPHVTDAHAVFRAERLGHPLISAVECVCNDVTLTEQTPLLLISGSNMSGKSTLLRSVGTNLVLAYCGARVNATAFESFPFQIGTAMRVSDSLQEGRSFFFSVVQRLKAVVDLTGESRRVLYLLDEILSGTNSHDRRRGAEAVICSLVNKSALGMVTTHDLTLTDIVDSMDDKAVNMHFEDQVSDGHMTFDYKLRDGVVQRSNAIELMRMMGLDV
ncbi:MAG TPA: DNA mismatch repair protein MutS [Planctomycetes bacterium]|nr:DNA mismatch repair protein MutS [Fuerstiella sp.]HIK95859.1 DNA mismatch repair protein MutS [Planctomycetota bacterium]